MQGSSDTAIEGLAGLALSAAFMCVAIILCCWCYSRLPEDPTQQPTADGEFATLDLPVHATDHTATGTTTDDSRDTMVERHAIIAARPVASELPSSHSSAGGQAAGKQAPSAGAAAGGDDGVHEQQPYYAAWARCYNDTRGGLFGDAISFVEENHDSVNNRKTESGGAGLECGGSGWTLLHQAAYWQLPRAMLERLAAVGADGLLADWDGLTPLDITAQGEQEGVQSRLEWRRMYRQVFQMPVEPPPAVETADAAEAADAADAADAAEIGLLAAP
jgi:hypothetical protein